MLWLNPTVYDIIETLLYDMKQRLTKGTKRVTGKGRRARSRPPFHNAVLRLIGAIYELQKQIQSLRIETQNGGKRHEAGYVPVYGEFDCDGWG